MEETGDTTADKDANEGIEKTEETETAQEESKGGAEAEADIVKLLRPKRSKSIVKSKLLVKDVIKFIEEMKRKIVHVDLDIRIIPSHSACRFELPIDMTRLVDLSPVQYLIKFCRVEDTRRNIYGSQYGKYTNENDASFLVLSDTRKIFENLFHEVNLANEMLHLRRLLDLDLSKEIDEDLFIAIACLMERIIVKNKGWSSAQDYKRNIFEAADFCSLNGKLHGIDVSLSLRNLLEFIRNA